MLQIKSILYRNKASYFAVFLLLQSVLLSIVLSACSSGFHLRENVTLAKSYESIKLENISLESSFGKAFELALEKAGGSLSKKATTKVSIKNLREGKRVVAYTSKRKARMYLVFLKIDYTIYKNNRKTPVRRINLDRSFVYDANYALGKAEEEKQIREGLYTEAARLILLRLQYSNENSMQ